MIEDEARNWVRERFGVPRETLLQRFADLVIGESVEQNLVAASTIPEMWNRHLLDSAQLVPLAEAHPGRWMDIGSGAGFPGMVAALLTERPVLLIEPRARRAAFLQRAAEALGVADRVSVAAKRVEMVGSDQRGAVISARAVANLADLLGSARHLSTRSTLWLLPKGQNAQSEVEAARGAWQGRFHVEPSLTQPGSEIIVATGVSAR